MTRTLRSLGTAIATVAVFLLAAAVGVLFGFHGRGDPGTAASVHRSKVSAETPPEVTTGSSVPTGQPAFSWTSSGDDPTGSGFCESLPPEIAARSMGAFDRATGEIVATTPLDLCLQAAMQTASPQAQRRAGLAAVYTFRNGSIKVDYHNVQVKTEETPDGTQEVAVVGPDPVSPAEAESRLR